MSVFMFLPRHDKTCLVVVNNHQIIGLDWRRCGGMELCTLQFHIIRLLNFKYGSKINFLFQKIISIKMGRNCCFVKVSLISVGIVELLPVICFLLQHTNVHHFFKQIYLINLSYHGSVILVSSTLPSH